jgi:hypothetical protein
MPGETLGENLKSWNAEMLECWNGGAGWVTSKRNVQHPTSNIQRPMLN